MKRFFVFLFLFLFLISAFSESKDFHDTVSPGLSEFFSEYPVSFEKQEKLVSDFLEILSEKNIDDPYFVISIVYPELLRYSQFYDFWETRANTIFYVNALGIHDFSIGIMQMKPDFAEEIEKQIFLDEKLMARFGNLVSSVPLSERKLRLRRIRQLSTLESQADYLLAFIEIYSEKLGLIKREKPEQIKILSVLFNSGLDLDFDEIAAFQKLKLFPSGIEKKSRWNYTDLCLEFYSSAIKYSSQES